RARCRVDGISLLRVVPRDPVVEEKLVAVVLPTPLFGALKTVVAGAPLVAVERVEDIGRVEIVCPLPRISHSVRPRTIFALVPGYVFGRLRSRLEKGGISRHRVDLSAKPGALHRRIQDSFSVGRVVPPTERAVFHRARQILEHKSSRALAHLERALEPEQ